MNNDFVTWFKTRWPHSDLCVLDDAAKATLHWMHEAWSAALSSRFDQEEEFRILRDFLRCMSDLEEGRPFDQTDSPKSYMGNARRLTAEAKAAIEMLKVSA